MTGTTPVHGGASPSSSPRLPSPPPFTEVQFGPKSPTIGLESAHGFQLGDAARIDDGASRRIRPGTKAADMAAGPPLVPLAQLDSPFALQEHLKALYHIYTHDLSLPITKETALKLATPPQNSDTGETVDKSIWLYELCRFLTVQANNLIIAFFAEKPPCSSATCPEMRASEWQYLCAVHDPPKSCCAIDYCCHTLDWATNILTSPKLFPSRMNLGGENGNVAAAMRQMTNIFRRVYRIFAHAWFQHREVFWAVEGKDGLYVFFKTVCDAYQLIPEDNYTIPHEAEGPRDQDETPVSHQSPDPSNMMTILGRPEEDEPGETPQQQPDGEVTTTISTGATTRRHKHTPSTGSHVNTIVESVEDEEAGTEAVPNEPKESHTQSQRPGHLSLDEGAFDGAPAEDPTPLASDVDRDPMLGIAETTAEHENTSPPKTEEQKPTDHELEETLVHLHHFDDTPAEESDVETIVPADEEKGAEDGEKEDTEGKEEEGKEEKEIEEKGKEEAEAKTIESEAESKPAGAAKVVDAVDYAMAREDEDKKEMKGEETSAEAM